MDSTPGILPKNDTLLILANPPGSDSKSTHYTPARWWASTMEDCMRQSGLHAYGSVRILAGLSALEAQVVLPRSLHDRRRPAILTENVALHTFEVASGSESEAWHTLKTWDSIHRNLQRVAERSAAQNIITLPEREILPLKLAPEVPPSERKIATLPYRPRAETAGHRRSEKLIRRGQQVATEKDLKRKEISEIKAEARKARASLNFDNHCVTAREEISDAKAAIDERMRALSRAAADPQKTPDELMKLNEEIEAAIAAVTQKIADTHFRHYRGWERNLDDARIEAWSNKLDDSVLLWDRRPFEPIRTHDDEIFPRYHQNLIYFEADENAISAQSLGKVPPEDCESLSGLFEALTLSFSSGNHISIAELAERLFPGRTSNDVVQLIPSLAYHVGKRVKPGCGPIPLADGSLDANKCFQENIDYDLSEVRVICLPSQVLWDILLEYHKHAIDYSPLQFNRLLGGTLTSYRTGDYRMDTLAKRLH
ncbi:hypothetical protein N7454_010130 [Penicillium verhagenii]|nr:hypothetical protein N7454_010130 [Penicillium verhagenii]